MDFLVCELARRQAPRRRAVLRGRRPGRARPQGRRRGVGRRPRRRQARSWRARIERVLGPASRIEPSSRASSGTRHADRVAPLPPLPGDEPTGSTCATSTRSRSTPRGEGLRRRAHLPGGEGGRARLGAHRRRLRLRARRLAPRRGGGARSLRLRPRPRRPDAPARALRRPLQPAPAPDRRCVTVEIPFDASSSRESHASTAASTEPRAPHLRARPGDPGGRRAGRRRADRGAELAEQVSRPSAIAGSRAGRFASRVARSRSPSTARAASSGPGSRASRWRTCSSRS